MNRRLVREPRASLKSKDRRNIRSNLDRRIPKVRIVRIVGQIVILWP